MRTTLDLSASLLEEAMALTNIQTKPEAITRALENLIQKEKVQQHAINNDGLFSATLFQWLEINHLFLFSFDKHFSLMSDLFGLKILTDGKNLI